MPKTIPLTARTSSRYREFMPTRALSDRLVCAWTQNIDGSNGDLARWIGLSDRQLQRRFVAAVGYGPQIFQRIVRFQRLLSFGSGSARQSLANLAYDAGYADQAHKCREFRELADATPQTVLTRTRSMIAMSDLFNTDDGRSD